MPQPISRQLLKVLNSDHFDPIYLLDITLVGQNPSDALHLTNAGTTLTWTSTYYGTTLTYLPMGFQVSGLDDRAASSAGDVPTVSVTATNVDAQMANLLSKIDFDGSEATLWLTDRRILTPAGPMRLAMGEVREVVLGDSMLNFQIVSILGQLERIQIPRRGFTSHCPYKFGEPACGIDITASPITLTSSVLTGCTQYYLVLPSTILTDAGNPADPNAFWDGATVWITDGVAGLQSAPFQRYELNSGDHRFWLRTPLRTVPQAGDPVKIRRRCNKTMLAGSNSCASFNNLDNFGGFPYVPPVRFKPDQDFSNA